MPDETQQDVSELDLDTDAPDSSDTDAASTTDSGEETSESDDGSDGSTTASGEESEGNLDLSRKDDKDGETTSKELNRERQVDSWEVKIKRGERKLSEAPSWIQDEIYSRKDSGSQKADESSADLDEIVEKKLNKREDERNFTSLYAEAKKLNLSSEQATTITDEFNDFVDRGYGKHEALQKALKIAGIPSIDEARKAELHDSMNIPRSGYNKDPDAPLSDPEAIKRMPRNKRVEAYEKIRKEGVGM